MILKIVGLSEYDFTNDDGQHISGTTLYATFPATRKNVVGDMSGKFSVGRSKLAAGAVSVGDTVDITFDFNGRVDKVAVVDDDVEV